MRWERLGRVCGTSCRLRGTTGLITAFVGLRDITGALGDIEGVGEASLSVSSIIEGLSPSDWDSGTLT